MSKLEGALELNAEFQFAASASVPGARIRARPCVVRRRSADDLGRKSKVL